MLRERNGMVLTADLARMDIPRAYLSLLKEAGEIERIARGVYSVPGIVADEMVSLQAQYKSAIFSHETALYLWGLTDRTPLFHSVTVPSGYNSTSLRKNDARVYYVKRDLHPLGVTTMTTPHGNEVKGYNPERTICDVLRSRNQMDVEFVNEAVKRYSRRDNKNLDQLYHYARQFGIQKIIRAVMEVLL